MRSGQVRRASLWVGATVVMGGLGVLNAPGTAADQNVADPPTIGGATASEVTDTTATLTAEVNPGGAPTSLSVSCTGGAYKWTATGTGPGRTPAPATAKMTGLTPSTAYTCALSATNSAGSATSSPANFTTSPAPSSGPTPTPNPTPTPTPTSTPAPTVTAPSVGATSASAVGSDRATVSAPVTPNGAATSATATCTGGAWTAGGAVAGSGASETTVAVPLTGLTGGTLYTCAIRATNTAGSTTSAAPVTFTTAPGTQATAKLAVSAKTVKARKGKGATYTVATFTDPADLPASSYTVTIAWGDGKTSKGTVTRTGKGTYKVTGKHTYRTGGVKAPKVRVGKAGAPAVSAQARPPSG